MSTDPFEEITAGVFDADEQAQLAEAIKDTAKEESIVDSFLNRMKGVVDEASKKCAAIEKDAITSATKFINERGFDAFLQTTAMLTLEKAVDEDDYFNHPLTRSAMTKGMLRAAYEAGRREVSA